VLPRFVITESGPAGLFEILTAVSTAPPFRGLRNFHHRRASTPDCIRFDLTHTCGWERMASEVL